MARSSIVAAHSPAARLMKSAHRLPALLRLLFASALLTTGQYGRSTARGVALAFEYPWGRK